LFGDDGARAAWLRRVGAVPSGYRHGASTERVLDGLAAHLEAHMDVAGLLGFAA
jgi:adenosylcobyric acid synthase